MLLLYITTHHLQGSTSKSLTIISKCVIHEDSLSTISDCLENSTVFQFYWPLILPWRRWRRRGGWWRQPGRGHRWCGCRSAGRRTRNSLEGQPSLPTNITNFLKASLQLHSRCFFLSLLVSAGVFGEQMLYEGLPDEQAQYIDFPIEGEIPCTTGPVVNIDCYEQCHEVNRFPGTDVCQRAPCSAAGCWAKGVSHLLQFRCRKWDSIWLCKSRNGVKDACSIVDI